MNQTLTNNIKSKDLKYLGKCNRKSAECVVNVGEGLSMLQNVFSMLKQGTCMCLNESY